MRSRWYHKPLLHTAHDHEKKVSWLELFYDLIFVASIIQLGDALSERVTETHAVLGPFASFAALFVPLVVAWMGFTFFANRFQLDDFAHRGLVFAKMFAVGWMAISAPAVLRGEHESFAVAYGVTQCLVAALHLRTWRQEDHAKPYSRYWGSVFAIGGVVWLVSALVPTPWAYVLWGAGVLAILSAPTSKRSLELQELYPLDQEHLSERYGLFTIIVLGESFVKVLTYLAAGESAGDLGYLGKASLNLLVTCCIWWIYFDDVAGSHIRKGRGSWVVWLYGHMPFAIGVTAVGVAVKKALAFDLDHAPDPAYAWLLTGSLAVVFASVAIIDSVTERRQAELSDRARVNVRFFSAGVLLLLGGLAGSATGHAGPDGHYVYEGPLDAGLFLALVCAICVAQVLFDIMMAPFEEGEAEKHLTSTADLARRAKETGTAVRSRGVRDLNDVVRRGTPSELRRDLYFFFMEGSWTRLIASFVAIYLVSNAVFAALYLLQPESIGGMRLGTFAEAFQFSVQTMTTIGYGVMHPGNAYGNLLVTIEAAFGLLGVALVTGLMFAKASRPKASVLFSRVMVLTRRHGVPTLMFRVGNARGNEVVEATVNVAVLVDDLSPEGHHVRKVVDLPLVRDRSPIFRMSWVLMHEVDETSPLHGIDWSTVAEGSAGGVISFIVTLMGYDATYAQSTHARHMYSVQDVRAGERFVDVVHETADGCFLIDYTKFHDTIRDDEALAELAAAPPPAH
jgi:inward rectifier potassium channel